MTSSNDSATITTENPNLAPIVLKIGGNDIDNPDFLRQLGAHIAALDRPVVVVHGGGKEIGQLSTRLGIEPQWMDGLRITDEETLGVVEMVLCGRVNKRLVRQLVAAGLDADGMSGADRGLLRARKLDYSNGDLGRVGEIDYVRAPVLIDMLAWGIVPVIAPLALGYDGDMFNINADHAAAAIAEAIGAAQVVFLTNVEAVLVDDQPRHAITAGEAEQLISEGTIFGGMIPKVRTALHAVALGIPQAVITNLHGLAGHGGTVFHAGELATASTVEASDRLWAQAAAQSGRFRSPARHMMSHDLRAIAR